jgi:drug/metabolite transporter (DMT)-like permease
MPIIVTVLLAAAMHASWNALVKPAGDRVALMAAMGFASMAVCLPFALFATAPDQAAWIALAASIALHVVYNGMLVMLYMNGEFNQLYPLARGTAPPLVAAAAWVVANESLAPAQVAGLVLLSAGLLVAGTGRRAGSARAVLVALSTGAVIASYTVVDGLGVRRADSVLGYLSWLLLGSGAIVSLGVALQRRRSGGASPFSEPMMRQGSLVAGLSVGAYGLVLWAQEQGDLAVVAALRETSVVFAAAIGAFVLREHLPTRRLAAAAVIAIGAGCLALG